MRNEYDLRLGVQFPTREVANELAVSGQWMDDDSEGSAEICQSRWLCRCHHSPSILPFPHVSRGVEVGSIRAACSEEPKGIKRKHAAAIFTTTAGLHCHIDIDIITDSTTQSTASRILSQYYEIQAIPHVSRPFHAYDSDLYYGDCAQSPPWRRWPSCKACTGEI
jgi:hypothetical protein